MIVQMKLQELYRPARTAKFWVVKCIFHAGGIFTICGRTDLVTFLEGFFFTQAVSGGSYSNLYMILYKTLQSRIAQKSHIYQDTYLRNDFN